MATAPKPPVSLPFETSQPASPRATAHLKVIPGDLAVRQQIRTAADAEVSAWDKSRALSRRELEGRARELLARLQLADGYVGFSMVALASAFWQDQVAAAPHQRRLLLLPHCMRDAAVCEAPYTALGLECQQCGACDLPELKNFAEGLGYRVLIAEGSPVVLQLILNGQVDAIVGVACLDSLEKTLDRILVAGIPCMAVPLLGNGCHNTQSDLQHIKQMVATPHRPAVIHTRTYLHLMRLASQLCEHVQLTRLAPPLYDHTSGEGSASPALPTDLTAAAEALAYEFLAAGGKYSRPFVTLAAYDALKGGPATAADGERHLAALPAAVRRVALAIEVFHKASLVHDDVEDGDSYRYGRPTLHRAHGAATAVNTGDFLIGLGYRLVAEEQADLGAEMVADLIAHLSQAHLRLCAGQGAELAWRSDRRRQLTPLEVLKIYALKTSPAFEVALYAGLRLAGPVHEYEAAIARFARHLGVGYQIVNDLDDWSATRRNKRHSGTDVLAGRPTVLLALAFENLAGAEQAELQTLLDDDRAAADKLARVTALYEKADVFRTARTLIERHYERAMAVAAEIRCEPLRRLLDFLADVILRKEER